MGTQVPGGLQAPSSGTPGQVGAMGAMPPPRGGVPGQVGTMPGGGAPAPGGGMPGGGGGGLPNSGGAVLPNGRLAPSWNPQLSALYAADAARRAGGNITPPGGGLVPNVGASDGAGMVPGGGNITPPGGGFGGGGGLQGFLAQNPQLANDPRVQALMASMQPGAGMGQPGLAVMPPNPGGMATQAPAPSAARAGPNLMDQMGGNITQPGRTY